MYPPGPSIAAPHNGGNTRQRHHVPTPTHAGGEKIADRTTAFPCSTGGVTCGRCWSSTGRKDGPPDSYLESPNPHESPFFFGFQKPFFFQQGKRNGFCRPRKVRTVQNALSGISHSAPLLVLSPRDPLRWARAGTPFLHVVCAPRSSRPTNSAAPGARLGSRAPHSQT